MKGAIELLKEKLEEIGADGLGNDGGCSCLLEDLCPCSYISDDCHPIKVVRCKFNGGNDRCMYSKQEILEAYGEPKTKDYCPVIASGSYCWKFLRRKKEEGGVKGS